MKVNVIRDSFAVKNCETSAWDRWREAAPEQRVVPSDELPTLDWLAENPEDSPVELTPPWMSGVLAASQNLSIFDTK